MGTNVFLSTMPEITLRPKPSLIEIAISPSGLVAIDKEADIVKEIFRLYVEEKFSIRGITEILTKRKIPTKLGGEKWCKSTVPKILRNST